MDSKEKKIQMLRDGKISNVLIKLGIPIMIGMIVSALYNVVDAYFVGGLGISQMAAVSVVFPISQIIIGLAVTFGSGAASYISRLLGEGNIKQANRTASTALFSSIAVGVISIITILLFLDKVLVFLGATDTVLPYAKAYAGIYIASSILSIINVTMNNIVTSEGTTKISMTAMLLGAGLNIILCPIFIYTFSWGIKGAAIATMVAQAVTTLFYVWYIVRHKGYLEFSVRYFVFDKEIYSQIFKVGLPMLAMQLLTSISLTLINTAANNYGDSAVAAMGIVTRVFVLVSYVIFGYSKGFQPVAGYNYGAKNYDRLDEAAKISVKWTTWFCIIASLILIVFASPIVSLFSKDTIVIDISSRALRANGIMFIFFGFQMVYASLLLAMGKAKEGAILSMSRQGIFFIPAILILPHVIGLNGVIYSQAIADLLTVILTVILALRLKKELKILKSNSIAEPLLAENSILEEF